jgi:hypothetical protein
MNIKKHILPKTKLFEKYVPAGVTRSCFFLASFGLFCYFRFVVVVRSWLGSFKGSAANCYARAIEKLTNLITENVQSELLNL